MAKITTIDGTKTFTSSPVIPTPTADGEAANKEYIDGVATDFQMGAILDGSLVNDKLADAGQAKFGMCAACHGADGKGNQMLGAPNLTDNTWLYLNPEWGLAKSVEQSIRLGRNGHMPAQARYIGEDKVHLVTAYVYSLSHKDAQ